MRPLRILHVMRAPVGGLFRHVVDLARAQAARGHAVGIVADASTGSHRSEAAFAELAPKLALGMTRIAMSRHLGLSDLSAFAAVKKLAASLKAEVVHGHGAKGGAYARLLPRGRLRVYTPHGGSLHYSRTSPIGAVYLTLERVLAERTELFLFESAYGLQAFTERVGVAPKTATVVHNGVSEAEFAPVPAAADATDLLFVGELRHLKGVDVLLEACARLQARGRPVSATIVGDGPDAEAFRAQAHALALSAVRFPGPHPARQAFALGRLLVVPSRAESLPYIVLEGAAARRPMIATAVGGIPEIFGGDAASLVPPGDAEALARAITEALDAPGQLADRTDRLFARVRAEFSVETMTERILGAYRAALSGQNAQI